MTFTFAGTPTKCLRSRCPTALLTCTHVCVRTHTYTNTPPRRKAQSFTRMSHTAQRVSHRAPLPGFLREVRGQTSCSQWALALGQLDGRTSTVTVLGLTSRQSILISKALTFSSEPQNNPVQRHHLQMRKLRGLMTGNELWQAVPTAEGSRPTQAPRL